MPDNQQGSGFINFDRFKNLNQFAADQNTKKIADTLGARGDAAQAAQSGANDRFNKETSGATVRFQPKQQVAFETAQGANGATYNPMSRSPMPASGAPAPGSAGLVRNGEFGSVGAGTTDPGYGWTPEAYRADDDQAKVVRNQYYAGPTDLQSMDPKAYAAMQAEDEGVQNETAGLGSSSGLAAYLQQLNGGSSGYTPAQNAFDAALYGQSNPGRFQQLATKYQNLFKGLSDSEEASKATAAGAKQSSDDAVNRAGQYDASYQTSKFDYEQRKKKATQEVLGAAANKKMKAAQGAQAGSVKNAPQFNTKKTLSY